MWRLSTISCSRYLKAYPVYGLEAARETAAASVTHPDGNMTLDPVVRSVETSKDADGATVITVRMTDRVYPFGINVNYRTYPDAGVIETWVDAVNNGKKMSSCANLRRAICRCVRATCVSHVVLWLVGKRYRMEEEPLTHGMKIIKNKDGLRNTHTAHPEVMFSLDGRPRENEGRVIGAALGVPRQLPLAHRYRRFRLSSFLRRYQRGQLGIHPLPKAKHSPRPRSLWHICRRAKAV